MAVACAGCGRDVADSARACLYCGEPAEPERPAPDGRRTNPHHVVWVPSPDAAGDARRLESLLRLDAYQAALIVRSRAPRIVRTLGDASAAEELAARARDLGLRAFHVDDHTLDTHPPVEAVEAASQAGDGVELGTPSGPFRIGPGAVDLLVTARVPVRRRRSSSRIGMFGGDPGATPGLPRVVKRALTTADHPGVLDVYPAGEARCLRVREQDTDFSGMRDPAHASALLHFARLVEMARGAAADAAYDDRFARFDDDDPARPGRVPVRAGVTVLDGVARFARYSRILWMSLKRAASIGRP